MAINLSKSTYCNAVQCPKMLWLKKNRPELFDSSVLNDSILEKGNEVGDLAMGFFGEYTEVPFGDLGGMIAETSKLISSGTPVIAEASFSYDGLFCNVDILRNLGNSIVEVYEVKSSSTLKPIYREDIAYQCYVLTKLGYSVRKACILHINTHYVRQGELDIHKLFRIEDLTKDTIDRIPEVRNNVKRFDAYMQQTEEPCDDIGQYCITPYDCGFFGYCTHDLPKPNIFDVHGVYASTKFKCYKNGVISFEDLNTYSSLSAASHMQVEHELFNYPPHIDKIAVKSFLDGLSYPLYFLDFESFQPAIPPYDNTHPFQQIVFQYSLHYIEHEGGKLEHREFLAYPGNDPRRALAEQLCRDIPEDVCTLAYNMSFEKSRIKGLAELYPDLAEHLMNIHSNIKDLMVPFQKKQYYSKAMQGSYSIKYVLPALFPDDPSLDYHNLEEVHNGAEAASAFEHMTELSGENLEDFRKNLLKYCGLDTFAMVKIWEKLNEVVENKLNITW